MLCWAAGARQVERTGVAMPGESAQREYERRRKRRQDRIARSRPRAVAVVVLAFAAGWMVPVALLYAASFMVSSIAPDAGTVRVEAPTTMLSLLLGSVFALRAGLAVWGPSRGEVAWRKGAEGERVVGHALEALRGDGVELLHDRRIPGSRANIDHLAVTPAGVFTVDAKRYSGKLEVRRRGSELWIKGRNRSKLLDQARRQAEVVTDVLERAGVSDVPVRPVLCFVGTEMPWLFAPKQADGVVLTTPRQLRKRLLPDGDALLGTTQVATTAEVLASALRPADQPSSRRADDRPDQSATSAQPASELGVPPASEANPGRSRRTCTRCGAPMVPRTRRRDGAPFLGCSSFPRCRHTEDVHDAGDRPSPEGR